MNSLGITLAIRTIPRLNIRGPLRWLLYLAITAIFALLLAAIILTSRYRTEVDHMAFQRGAETAEQWENRLEVFAQQSDPASKLWQWLRPVPAQMPEAQITELPADWVSYDTARRDAFKNWCSRPDTPKCDEMDDEAIAATMKREDFTKEFNERRQTYLRTLAKPPLDGVNLADANLFKAHMPGILLRRAILPRANLAQAQLEGANLSGAQMEGANLSLAQMQGADLSGAQMEGADLRGAQMEGADLFGAQMQGADLRGAKLTGAA